MTEQEKLNEQIKAAIKERGFMLITVCDVNDNDDTRLFTELEDGYVYSVGCKERGIPDIVVLCGPVDDDETMTRAALMQHINAAANLIGAVIANWAERPLANLSQLKLDSDDRTYFVNNDTDCVAMVKELMQPAGGYYGTEDYELLVVAPLPKS